MITKTYTFNIPTEGAEMPNGQLHLTMKHWEANYAVSFLLSMQLCVHNDLLFHFGGGVFDREEVYSKVFEGVSTSEFGRDFAVRVDR